MNDTSKRSCCGAIAGLILFFLVMLPTLVKTGALQALIVRWIER